MREQRVEKKKRELDENELLVRAFFGAENIQTGDVDRVRNLIKNEKNGSLKLSGPNEEGFFVFTLRRKQIINYLVPEALYYKVAYENLNEEAEETPEAMDN